ncbi:MAG TPA: hypothetical protein VEX62_07080 [Candidatus Limnocylindrales bacterium]|nr:hypothetical protein [Candidatus Limnocylindrales bacterium]
MSVRSVATTQTTRRWLPLAVVLTAALVSLVLKASIPLVLNTFALRDDMLFVHQAMEIREGDWLGPYSEETLSKGPGYPVFLAVTIAAGLPAKVADHALFLVAAAFLSLVVGRIARSAVVGIGLFILLALAPQVIGDAHLTRDTLYTTLTALVVTGGLLLALDAFDMTWAAPRRLALAGVLGFVWGMFWLTREEGIWLTPALALLALAFVVGSVGALRTRKEGLGGQSGRLALRVGSTLLALVIGASIPIAAVSLANARVYGTGLINDLRDGTLPGAYGALTRISVDQRPRYVPVPSAALETAYAVSPAMAELRPFLDESSARWASYGCVPNPALADVRPDFQLPCGQVMGGWFVWALRSAIRDAGHWPNEASAQAYMTSIATEVNSACDSGIIDCGPLRASLEPPVEADYVFDGAALAPRAIYALLARRADLTPSRGNPSDLFRLASVVHQPMAALQEAEPSVPLPVAEYGPGFQVVDTLGLAYGAVMPIVLTIGLVGVLVTLASASARRLQRRLLFVAFVCLVVVGARVAMITYIEVASWPGAISTHYLLPAWPFAACLSVIGMLLLYRWASQRVGRGGLESR